MTQVLDRANFDDHDELTPEEAESFLEEQTRKYLDMSLAEFRRRAQEDTLPEDNPAVIHIALLAGVELHSC